MIVIFLYPVLLLSSVPQSLTQDITSCWHFRLILTSQTVLQQLFQTYRAHKNLKKSLVA